MEEIIALLKFAVDNEHNFTEHDPDKVKAAWIQEARIALAKLNNTQVSNTKHKSCRCSAYQLENFGCKCGAS